jgi:hypothetical protein
VQLQQQTEKMEKQFEISRERFENLNGRVDTIIEKLTAGDAEATREQIEVLSAKVDKVMERLKVQDT